LAPKNVESARTMSYRSRDVALVVVMQLLRAKEAAQRARMSVRRLKRLIAAGVGPAVTRLGEGHSRILVREDAFEAWVSQHTAPPLRPAPSSAEGSDQHGQH
jgi:hypothetical protein